MALQECPPSTLQSERQGQPVGYLDFYDNRIDESVQGKTEMDENHHLFYDLSLSRASSDIA